MYVEQVIVTINTTGQLIRYGPRGPLLSQSEGEMRRDSWTDQKISRCLSLKHRMLYKAHSSRLADSAEFGSFIIFELYCNSREGNCRKLVVLQISVGMQNTPSGCSVAFPPSTVEASVVPIGWINFNKPHELVYLIFEFSFELVRTPFLISSLAN